MESRREVEEYVKFIWETRDSCDGRLYCVQVKVAGEEKPFNVKVSISNTLRATQLDNVGRTLLDQDWEAMVKVAIEKQVRAGLLDGWPPSKAVPLEIVWQQVEDLFFEAVRKGMIHQ